MWEFIMSLFGNWGPMVAAVMVVIGALSTLCAALAALFLLIPGEQPEKFFQGVADFLAKYSKKP